MAKTLIVASKIKELTKVNEKQLSISSDFYDELNKKVEDTIKKACKRAIANGRTTVMGRDV